MSVPGGESASPPAAGTTAGGAPRYICFLCRRKFKSAQLLTRHKQLSELHRRNLVKQDEEIQQKKEEVRQVIGQVRKQLQEVEQAIAKSVGVDEDLQNQRSTLELKMRHALGEYGQSQEKLEATRLQQQQERAGGGPVLKKLEVRETRIGRLIVSAGVASWQGNKDVQEDRYILDVELESSDGQKVVGFVVLDGHSGSLCVDALLDWLPRNLQKCLSSKGPLTEDNLRQTVIEACVLTDDEFLLKAREREVLDGSTMILALIYLADGQGHDAHGRGRYKLLIGNLGDSRAVLCRAQAGRLSAVRLSEDHKPGRPDEQRRIEAKGGVVDMQGVWRVFTPGPANFAGRSVLWGLAVSRAFGDLLMKEPQAYGVAGATGELVSAVPEVHSYDLQPSEDRFLVLACDGVWDVLNDDDAVSVCIQHRSADLAAHALVRRSFEIGSDDNITSLVVAWKLDEDEVGSEAATKKPKPAD
eukprot:TRINITY_DN70771_c0_g1_i1.p1 TRINITY_DN70771_c0_g1~~TRINITY_DN70771_c0_g1_i1.p1  ORF type:complete len:471 (-),score=111.19 TRINITY_DN70771_c0_g1_i1:279-1691(-)